MEVAKKFRSLVQETGGGVLKFQIFCKTLTICSGLGGIFGGERVELKVLGRDVGE